MNINTLIEQMTTRRDKLSAAISAMQALDADTPAAENVRLGISRRKGIKLSAEVRERMAKAQQKRWAKIRRNG